MAATLVSDQSPRLTSNYLNQKNRVGDPAPGVSVSTAQVSGSIVQPYTGQLGGKLTLSEAETRAFSDPTMFTIYGGIFQYVQFRLGSTNAPAAGLVLCWYDERNYIVTPDIIGGGGRMAGICLNPVTRGNYDFIQIGGDAQVLFGAITAVTPAIGDMVVMQASNNQGDILTATTTVTFALLKTVIGVASRVAPVASQLNPVRLNMIPGWGY
jgi:hypothetical protein